MEEISQSQTQSPTTTGLFSAALVLTIVALAAAGYGVFVAYRYREIDKVVGGDAYNFIILGLRGLLWVGIGCLLSLFAAAMLICDSLRRK